MAIGSAPEIGASFSVGDQTFDWAAWRDFVGDDLLGGYASLHTPDPLRISLIDSNSLTGPYEEA